jgi:magnesium-transporting ATPase (P-type)
MSPFDVPSTQPNREILTLGVIISTMVYGGVATLFLTYIPLLLKTSHAISRRLRNFLLAYVVFMVAISTVNTVTLIIAFTIGRNILPFGDSESGTTGNMINLLTFPNGMAGALCVTFASWGADGFMVSLLIQMSGRERHFIYIFVSYGGVRCYMKEFRDLVDLQL